MPRLKYDVTESDPEEAKAAGTFESPQPGLYRFEIASVSLGNTKGDDGKPDKTKPYVEVVFKCANAKYKNAQVWGYFIQPGHPGYDKKAAQKWDQLLLALGISTKTRKGTLDTDKQMVGKFVTIRVRGGKNQSGDYRAEFGSVFPDGHAGTIEDGASSEGDDGEMLDGEEDELLDDDVDWDARLVELKAAEAADLKSLAKEYEIKISGLTKSKLAEAIVEYEKENTGDPTGDDDELMEEEPATEYLTREQLTEMDNPTLAATAKDFDIVVKGMRRTAVVDAILKAQAAPADVGGDEEPF